MNKETFIVLRKTSFLDYPGLISAVIFFPGCNLHCPWCHNRELVLNTGMYKTGNDNKTDYIGLDNALLHIKDRKNVLGGVVLSGGEPTLYSGLGELVSAIKTMGLKCKLDTNGLLPDILETLIKIDETKPDYIAMDLKTSPFRYWELLEKTVYPGNPEEAIQRSAALIRASGIEHEFRSINLPESTYSGQDHFFGEKEKAAIALLAGDSVWNIRPFLPGNCLDPAWNHSSQTNEP